MSVMINTNMQKSSVVEYLTVTDAELHEGPWPAPEREVLSKINRRVAAGKSLEEIIDFVFQQMRSISACDRIGIAFVEEDGRRITARYAIGDYQPLVLGRGYSEDLKGSSLEPLVFTGKMRLIHDLAAYLQEKPSSTSTRMMVREGVRSSMTCPLMLDGRCVAVLFRSSRKPYAFDGREARLFAAVSERIGQAVEKAWRIEQLETANRNYRELLSFVSHELKSPLGAIMANCQLLLDGYFGALNGDQESRLQSVGRKSHYLMGIVREYLELARIEGGDAAPDFHRVRDFVSEVVEHAIDILLPEIEERKMRIERQYKSVPEGVLCDPGLLQIAFINLIENAIKYGNENGVIRISISSTANVLCVSVWNEGPGFPAADRPRLFRKFSRLSAPELHKRKGTGVGLYTVWRVIMLHQGRVDARSREGSWAEFSFEIPLPRASEEETH